MSGWATFWAVLLIVVLAIFALLTIVIAIGGFFDIKALFSTIERQHAESADQNETTGSD